MRTKDKSKWKSRLKVREPKLIVLSQVPETQTQNIRSLLGRMQSCELKPNVWVILYVVVKVVFKEIRIRVSFSNRIHKQNIGRVGSVSEQFYGHARKEG